MKYIGLDIEAINLRPFGGTIWILSLTENNKTTLHHDCWGFKKLPANVRKKLESRDYCKVIHSSQYDCPYIELVLGCKIKNIWDTDLCETVIQGMKIKTNIKNIPPGSPLERLMKNHSTRLNFVLPRYGFKSPNKEIRKNFIDRPLGKKFTKVELNYAGGDTKYLPKIQKAQQYILKRDNLLEVALLENEVAERYHDMKVRGIGFDAKIWKSIADKNQAEFAKRMSRLPKEVDNWNSEKQVKKYFMNKGICIPSYSELDKIYLQTKNKTLANFIYARELHKAVTSYGYNWLGPDGFVDADSRIRCDVTQIINTGRNSMSNPNLQQLPGMGNADFIHKMVMDMIRAMNKGTKMEWEHRKAFVPKKGHVFVIGDFSGQEIGIMAAASEEKLWIDAMLRGEDIHGLTASLINPTAWANAAEKGCTFPKKCKCKGHQELRMPAKINNFMLAYGGGPDRLAENTGMTKLDARVYVGAHKRIIPNLTKWLERNGREALASGVSYSADPYRRRRVLRGEEAWQVINQGKNNPVQSAGANMLKLAMVSLPWSIPINLVIHDEIICEVPKKDGPKALKTLKSVMERSADYITGIKGLIQADPKIAMNIMKD